SPAIDAGSNGVALDVNGQPLVFDQRAPLDLRISNSVVDIGAYEYQAITLTSIAVTPANPTIMLGATLLMTATGTYSDASTHDLTSLASWSVTSGPGSVTTGGLYSDTASAGTATVQAAAGAVNGSTTITVNAVTFADNFSSGTLGNWQIPAPPQKFLFT